VLATDFFTTEVWTAFGLVMYYCLFFIHVGSRKVYVAGITRNPTDDWMRQAARISRPTAAICWPKADTCSAIGTLNSPLAST
jgi:hypothetical protein